MIVQTGRPQKQAQAKPGVIPGNTNKEFFERKLDKMKKLFALVLSLALVVAFAVPALASGWAQLDWQIPTYSDITVALTGLDLVENTSKIGSLYAPLSTYYPVVENSRVHFYAEVTLPSEEKLTDAMKSLIGNWGLELDIVVSNIELDPTFKQYKNSAAAGEFNVADYGSVKEGFTVVFDASTYNAADKTVWGYECWGSVNADGKDATVTATIGFYNRFDKNGKMIIDSDQDGVPNYIVYHNHPNFPNGFLIDVCKADGSTNFRYVYFPVKGDKVDKSKTIRINANLCNAKLCEVGDEFSIVKSIVKNPDFVKGTTYATAEQYSALKAVYDDVFKFLGFEYDEANYMTEAHFEHYFGTIIARSEKITYPNGNIVVAPVSPELPQTGDNASIVGFAMIAVALVAAAVVTVKKVRA